MRSTRDELGGSAFQGQGISRGASDVLSLTTSLSAIRFEGNRYRNTGRRNGSAYQEKREKSHVLEKTASQEQRLQGGELT
jgi:hypothetical protein